jgi:hypothetical protein
VDVIAALFLSLLQERLSWPEADALFHRDPRWLGGDAAFSVDLGGERILWLFGDSFVGDGSSPERASATFVRNSAAVQQGRDPARATIAFAWREEDGEPASWIPEDGAIWRWPSHGIVLDGVLTLFTWRIERTGEGAFGFRAVGWDAWRVADTSGAPRDWTLEPCAGFTTPFPIVMGVAVLEQGEHVLAYAVREPGNHDVYLLRYGREDFRSGRLTAPEWFDRDHWVPQAELTGAPAPVIAGAHTEFSVQRLPDGRLVQVQTEGFGASVVIARTALHPEGPWSPPIEVARPPESAREGILVYAAKAHPELIGAELVVTYATNSTDLGTLVRDDSLYYPRFLRIALP